MGLFLSVIMSVILILYAYLKVDVLIKRRAVDIMSTVDLNKFSPDDVFGSKNGFNLAIALTAYDNNPLPILDPTIGEIVFHHTTWGPNDNELIKLGVNSFESHTCSRAELGLEDSSDGSSRFFPIVESMKKEVDLYSKKFKCADESELYLYGDYNSYKASSISV